MERVPTLLYAIQYVESLSDQLWAMEFSSKTTLYISHKFRLATGSLDEHSFDFYVINWSPRIPDLNPIEHLWDVSGQGVKGHHTAPTNLTELWKALANIWQVIPIEGFQKLVESMPRHVAAVIKARGGPNCYLVGIPNSVALQCISVKRKF
ncbi:transposable element Tcb2 transposase [Trichonephila clavipes]|nr:transposable element Tcb2 transposase [Trichonephila clavipes]